MSGKQTSEGSQNLLAEPLYRVGETETATVLEAWRNILDLIDSLEPSKIIPGHMESGLPLSRDEDLAHNRKYLDLFATKIIYADKKPAVHEVNHSGFLVRGY